MKQFTSIILVIIFVLSFHTVSFSAKPQKGRTPVIVIDPGHGGRDSGAIKGGVMEKTLNLDIAIRLQTLLKARGIKVYMTRTTDRSVGLYSRSALANRINADLFISIHNNAGSRGDKGTMTLYYPGSAKTDRGLAGRDIAKLVQKELNVRLGSANLGLRSRPQLAVLRTTKMPAVLAEVGYMSDKNELAKLKTATYRQKSAVALEKAIIKALGIK